MIPIHSLYWPNINSAVVDGHRACSEKQELNVIYTAEQTDHGRWLEATAREELLSHEAVAFMDIDCLAYSADAVNAAISYALDAHSFIGLAQSAFQRPAYAAPAFLVITRDAYKKLGSPRLRLDYRRRFDVGQRLSATADAQWFAYRVLYPIGYHFPSTDGPWRLEGFGHYGIGTEYAGGFFHLFQSRLDKAVDLFRLKAEQILSGEVQPTTPPIVSHALSPNPPHSVVGRKRSGLARLIPRRI